MKRPRAKASARLTPEADRLVTLSLGLAASGSGTEDRYWADAMGQAVARLADHGHDNVLNAALDHLFQTNGSAYEALMEAIETHTESASIEHGGESWQVLLVAAPIVAWSKYAIPSGAIAADAARALSAHLQAHVMAATSRMAFAPYLFSIDQLPRQFSEVRRLTRKLGTAAIEGAAPKLDLVHLPETANLLADNRFLLTAVAAPMGQPLFRWQTLSGGHATRANCLEQWIAQGRPNLAPLLTGCVFECLLPEAYYVSCREADRSVRPYSIRAAATFLETTLNVTPENLTATIAAFGGERVDEYRIGFSRQGQDEVAYGVVWPLYGREDEQASPGPIDEIRAQLKACGIGAIEELKESLPPEYCDDCGAPLFPDTSGDVVHAELPEEADEPRAHFH